MYFWLHGGFADYFTIFKDNFNVLPDSFNNLFQFSGSFDMNHYVNETTEWEIHIFLFLYV